MARNLPPPIALRAFEVSARLLSFTRAANELNVTQAAVSHQIKILEEYLNVPLFVRMTRKLMLTDEGQSLYSVVSQSFTEIETIAETLRAGKGDEVLSVSLTPYFSSKWLTVRLTRFWARHPNIDLRLHHTAQPGNLRQDRTDLSITWGLNDVHNLDFKPLITANVVPVCSPSIISEDKPISTVDDLYRHTLLHEEDYSLWKMWLEKAGAGEVNLRRGTTMDDSNVVIQAAIDGQGVALGSDVLCADEIEAGRLVMPFDIRLAMPYSYYIVFKPGALQRPKIKAFYEWIVEEAEQMWSI